MKENHTPMTFNELKARLEKIQQAIVAIQGGTYDVKPKQDIKKMEKKLIRLQESLQSKLKLILEMDKGVIHTDDENKAKDLAKQGVQVQLHKKGESLDIKEAEEGLQFDLNQTKEIAKEVAKATAMALKEDGMEIASAKILRLEEMAFDTHFQYKDGKEDEFSFHIDQDKNIILSDFNYSEKVGQVGLKGAGEPHVNRDVLKANILKCWAKLDGNMKEDAYDPSKIYGKKDEPQGDLMQQLEKALKEHDWYYMMSDDHRWYKAGIEEAQNIRNLIEKLRAVGRGDEAEALYQSYNNRNKLEEASVGSIQKKHGEIVAKMKALAAKYKSGDQSVVPELKALTAEKKKLEAELDAAVAGTGKDQELDSSANEGKDYDKDGKVEKPEEEYKGVKDKAIKKAMGKTEAKKAVLKEDWGSSDQSIMNRSIHKDLGEPEEMPMPFDNDFESAIEDAVDFYWNEWEEYKSDRDGLVDHAKKLYYRAYFPEKFAGFQKMFSEAAEESYVEQDEEYGNKKFYIKVAIRDAKRALELIADNPAYDKAVEIDGSDTYYLTNPGLAYDLQMDFGTQDIQVIDTNVDMNEMKGETELVQDPKTKEFTRRMKMTPKDMETIEKVQAMVAKEKSLKKEEEEDDDRARDITGKAYQIGDIIDFKGHKFQCQIGQRGIVVLQKVDDQYNPIAGFIEGGTPQFTAILKNAKIVRDHAGGIAEGGVNPEGDEMVLNFVKKLAKIYNIPMAHAVNFILASIKRQGY